MSKQELSRVRRICLALPETSERISHGEPTFFVGKRVFAMFSNNHHDDGHLAVLVPTPRGVQDMLIKSEPSIFYFPAYVGQRGWVGIELKKITIANLRAHLETAWELVATPTIRKLRTK